MIASHGLSRDVRKSHVAVKYGKNSANIGVSSLRWFQQELGRYGLGAQDKPRAIQQHPRPFASAPTKKKFCGETWPILFHLICTFSLPDDPIRKTLAKHHFDAIYLDNRKMDFISPEFHSLMFEIWKVKYLQMPLFREVIDVHPD